MKVWEKIAKDFHSNKFESKTEIANGMYFHRWIPCECNEEHVYITTADMDKLCEKHHFECRDCLKEWLDCEIAEEMEEVIEGQVVIDEGTGC